MAESSRRAARPADRGGLPNVLFVVSGVETPPAELLGRASLVTVTLPWGSLLRGLLGLDARAAGGLASLVGPGGALEALVSIERRDGLDGIGSAIADGRLPAVWAGLGFGLAELRPAAPAEVLATGSSWAKRLGADRGRRRSVTRLVLHRLP